MAGDKTTLHKKLRPGEILQLGEGAGAIEIIVNKTVELRIRLPGETAVCRRGAPRCRKPPPNCEAARRRGEDS